MGVFQPEASHNSQVSSKTSGIRWKPVNVRMLSLVGVLSVTMALMVVLYAPAKENSKLVYLVIDGQVQEFQTSNAVLGDLLRSEQIALRPYDKISAGLGQELNEGDRIIINRAEKINLTVDGKTQHFYTTEGTIGDAIAQFGYSLNENDKIFPSLDSTVNADMEVKIVRINKQVVQRTVDLPFKVIKTADPTLEKGKTKVTQEGAPGVMIQHIEKVYSDGELASMRMIGKEVGTVTRDKVIAVGTKVIPKPEPVVVKTEAKTAAVKKTSTSTNASSGNNVASKNGVNFEYKSLLKNVSLTAYSSEQPGIGTRTASGTRVTEGRTIAVDPNVVPMGWWVYIEGLGFRRAEDTGGAIKGNKMDVYFDSLNQAKQFGRKSRAVYVIGPVKPESN